MNVIFVCNANVGRSQVAEALFNVMSGHRASSAGVRVDEDIETKGAASRMLKHGSNNRRSIPFMLERGVDVSENVRTQMTPELANSADLVVAILDWDQKVDYLYKADNVEFWDLPDPIKSNDATAFEVFEEVERRVVELVSRIG